MNVFQALQVQHVAYENQLTQPCSHCICLYYLSVDSQINTTRAREGRQAADFSANIVVRFWLLYLLTGLLKGQKCPFLQLICSIQRCNIHCLIFSATLYLVCICIIILFTIIINNNNNQVYSDV